MENWFHNHFRFRVHPAGWGPLQAVHQIWQRCFFVRAATWHAWIMKIRAVLISAAVLCLVTPRAAAEPSVWAVDRAGLIAVDAALYAVNARGVSHEYAFVTPDRTLLCGRPVTQFMFAFCEPTGGQFPAALQMPASVPGVRGGGPPRQIEVRYRPDGPPIPRLWSVDWGESFWPDLALDAVRVLAAGSSVSFGDSMCWVRGQDEVHCIRVGLTCWGGSAPDSCLNPTDAIGFSISSSRYELFSTRA